MHDVIPLPRNRTVLAADKRFEIRVAATRNEIESALRLRFRVFSQELGSTAANSSGLESDLHDHNSQHLIMIDRTTGQTVGTYRMKSTDLAESVSGFYSNTEFTLETLPVDLLKNGIEIGRACIAREHRNTRAIFLIWKALARQLSESGKRYFFGCCSIFTKDATDGERAYTQLQDQGFVHDRFRVHPRRPIPASGSINTDKFKLPGLFEMYLRIGSRVCGPPIYDEAFGTVDFFVIFDLLEMDPKYRRMFLDS
ncbi:MAG: GNAT family N-acyltransferase [Pyrinomonadaceae bacterium]